MKNTILIVLILFATNVYAQTIRLSECYEKAVQKSALSGIEAENQKILQLKTDNLKTNWYPSFNLNAQATYQSDVPFSNISFPIPNMKLPTPTKDQYKIALDIAQLIYDGGMVKNQTEMENINIEIENKSIDIKQHTLKEQVCGVYFGLVVMQATIVQMDSLIATLNAQLKVVESAVANGVMLSVEREKLKAGIAKAEQQKFELQSKQKSAIAVLNELTGLQTTPQTIFSTDVELKAGTSQRNELQLFDLQNQKLSASSQLIDASRMPKVAAFAQLGYGRPGINIVDDTFSEYYVVGVKASWNIYDWHKAKRDREMLSVSQNIVNKQKSDVEQKFEIARLNKLSEIESLQQLIEKDREIVEIRNGIVKTMESQLQNGVITTTIYLTEKNEQTQANIQLKIHEIKLKQAEAELELIINE